MSPELLKAIADTNQWSALMPEIVVGSLALLLLVLEMALPKSAHGTLFPRVALVGLVATFAGLALSYCGGCPDCIGDGLPLFGGMIQQSATGHVWRLFFLGASALVCFLSSVVLPKHAVPRVEFYHIVLVVTGALMLLGQSNHFVLLFVALETVTVGFYVLVAYFRRSPLSLEAGLKYLVMGALSTSLLLFGIVLLYGVAGNPTLAGHSADALNFAALRNFIAQNPDNPLVLVGAALVLGGIAFKIGAVPFQIWIPDVYQGAPTPVTAFLGVSSKAAGFALLLILVHGPFLPLVTSLVVPLLSLIALLSLLFGNLAALGQTNVKRLMGLSGVSHAGFLLIGVIASVAPIPGDDNVRWAAGAVIFYLTTYLLGSMAVFGVMAHLAGADDADQDLRHYAELSRRSPLLSAVLAVGLGSLAGIPPLAGFMGKVLIFVAAFKAHLWTLLAVAIVAVVLSIYYYFGWIRAAFFSSPESSEPRPAATPIAVGFGSGATLVLLALATVLLGVYQGPVGLWLGAK